MHNNKYALLSTDVHSIAFAHMESKLSFSVRNN